LDEASRRLFAAALSQKEHGGSIKELINVTENLENYDLQPAYTEEQYGEFLLNMAYEEHSEGLDKLMNSNDPDYLELGRFISKLEEYVDVGLLGREYAAGEAGVFTKYGYLTHGPVFIEKYSGVEDIPAKYQLFGPDNEAQTECSGQQFGM
jgi:hypothetical protein